MELFSFPSSSVTVSPSSSSTKVLSPKSSFFSGQTSTLVNIHRYPNARKLKISHFRGQAADSKQASSKSNPGIAQATQQETQSKDENLVFVAGSTGKVGSRTVRELLKLGFRVRAGVRSAQKAESLVQSVQQMKLEGASAVEKLDIVECDLERDRIELAIANASVVICCIGASEKEVFDITGPYRIDYQATKNLIDAATLAGVNHFILLTSLGTNKIGFPAAILNLFWGVLIWKRKAEEALINSGLPYTIVRPGGMERPTDAYKETHNVSLANEDTLFGGQVSNLQVAELIAFMAKNRSTSYCKVVEVIAETTAPLSPFAELLSEIPSQRLDSSSPKEPKTASEPDPVPSQNVVLESSNSVIEKEPVQTDVQIPKPLSSYIGYEDLKPPTSPSPTPSTSQVDVKARDVSAEQESDSTSDSQASSAEPIEEGDDKGLAQTEIRKMPLSPYIVYDDLKPPTSPTPTASVGIREHAKLDQEVSGPSIAATQINILVPETAVSEMTSAPVEVQERKSLSPYTAYEDLKPPTSPTPTPSGLKNGPIGALPVEEAMPISSGGSDVTEETPAQVVKNELPKVFNQNSCYLSPYPAYDDWKPPSSPSPNAWTVLLFSESTIVGTQISTNPESSTAQQPPTLNEPEDRENVTTPRPRPLSPFTMYEGLKPPSSPTPRNF